LFSGRGNRQSNSRIGAGSDSSLRESRRKVRRQPENTQFYQKIDKVDCLILGISELCLLLADC
jgi:hypothetical protein